MTTEFIKEYYEFASNLSFFEFLQEEFGGKLIENEEYEVEIRNLSQKEVWNIEELSTLLSSHSRVFDVLEAILQFRRFTNTQLVHFLFDVNKLNSLDIDVIYPYFI
ncbi:MAG: hypothetical protein KAU62_09660, partial [Candidatus Heimdallarchaeota archaeon]|nr:hypothetical protein [Candidatus Heimdallarchaeota archaeon]MCK4611407.1 hypothetical protein [Candidatus Heimdallarchaeota archaeon]